MRTEKEESVQQAVATANDEVSQLRGTIAALRDAIEHNNAIYEQRLQDAARDAQDEINQLQETIKLLRERLAERGASHEP
jgi:peptidoglycan hydrolase CwlO-like protein